MPARYCYNVLLFVLFFSTGFVAPLYEGDKCFLKDGSGGNCKLIKECPTAVEGVKRGVNPILCGFQGIDTIVCCKGGGEQTTNPTSTNTTTNPVTSRTPGVISKQKCKEYADYAYEKIPSPTLLLYPHFRKKLVCDIHRNTLLVGSIMASRREFPHMALIGYKQDDEVVWECGGSLISENFVLTAMQCLVTYLGPAKLVRVGFTNKTDPTRYMQERIVSELIPYPRRKNTIYHDISLLRLSEHFKFNTYVRPACLQTERHIPYDIAIISGWGASYLGGEPSDELLTTTVEFYDVTKCNSSFKSDISRRGLKDGILDDLMICTWTSKIVKTICHGDYGGPLQVYHKETEEIKCMYDIVGVISFTKGCGLRDIPGVHTRVSAYIKWIEDIVWPN